METLQRFPAETAMKVNHFTVHTFPNGEPEHFIEYDGEDSRGNPLTGVVGPYTDPQMKKPLEKGIVKYLAKLTRSGYSDSCGWSREMLPHDFDRSFCEIT